MCSQVEGEVSVRSGRDDFAHHRSDGLVLGDCQSCGGVEFEGKGSQGRDDYTSVSVIGSRGVRLVATGVV